MSGPEDKDIDEEDDPIERSPQLYENPIVLKPALGNAYAVKRSFILK